MKQILQDIKNGKTLIEQVPIPAIGPNELLIRSRTSLISTGTERMIVEFGNASLLQKARQQPDKVKMVLDKVRTDGLLSTVEAVSAKLASELPLGYSNVGIVESVGANVHEFKPGDRVLSNGFHAEFVAVGRNLCAKVPDGLDDDQAVFSVAGAIALQGVRLSRPTVGECFVVVGLGLIGLLTVQILRANGCRVLGLDFDAHKLQLAAEFGAEVEPARDGDQVLKRALEFSRGRGVDGVIITASAKSNDVVHQSAQMSRKRGKIVLVGVVGLNLQRSDFYEKELSFQVSCSYGPGRYDSSYELDGQDYPIGFVRWTEQRNFEAVLDMLANGDMNVQRLISARYTIANGKAAYDLLSSDSTCLGILLEYDDANVANQESQSVRLNQDPTVRAETGDGAIVGALGAGNYASRVLLPAFKQSGAVLNTIVSSQGISGSRIGRKLGFAVSSTDAGSVFESSKINSVIIATRHDSHADFVICAIAKSLHVFVEKPLALTMDDVDRVKAAYHEQADKPVVMVGFNRRFAPLVQKLKSYLNSRSEPLSLIYNCNAGDLDATAWTQDIKQGGGRIVGEACHFIDLSRFLVSSEIISLSATPMRTATSPSGGYDTVSISIQFRNGSLAVINYFANGHRSYPKERLEVYQSGQTFVLENFKTLRMFGNGLRRKVSAHKDARGQGACVTAFVEAIEAGGPSPIPFDQIVEVSRFSVQAAEQVRG